jgi:hypothetical protein
MKKKTFKLEKLIKHFLVFFVHLHLAEFKNRKNLNHLK